MIKNIIIGVISVIVAVIASLALVNNQPSQNLQGTTNYDTVDVSDGYLVDGTTRIDGSGNLTAVEGSFSGGTVTVTTSNTATSTLTAGCFQFYATSTATAHKFQASTTPGTMYSTYGTCPNL